MKNYRNKYEAPIVEILEIHGERLCASPEGSGVQRIDYEEEEWQ
jgi:hypothetical protein